MAGYGYGYANFTSQPQQYNGGSFASQNAGTYGYATQPGRVVQQSNFQATSSAYGPAYSAGGQGQASVQAATTGGYGYFQRASEQNPSYADSQKTSYAPTQQGLIELYFRLLAVIIVIYLAFTYKHCTLTIYHFTVFAYGTAKPATQYSGNTVAYQKPQNYSSQPSTTFTGYTAQQRPNSNPPSYNNSGVSYNKPKVSRVFMLLSHSIIAL